MTDGPEVKASVLRAYEVLSAYGADEARWPTEERENVRQAIAADPILAGRFEEEAEMDALLALAPVEAPSFSLQTRILSSQVGGKSDVSLVEALVQVLKTLWPYGSVAIPAGALTASIFLGVASGSLTTPTADEWSDDQSYDVLALALGDAVIVEEW